MTQLVLHLVLTLVAMGSTALEQDQPGGGASTDGGGGDELARIINGCEWTSRQNVISEILLERYRKYVMDRFFLLNDVCAVYEWNKNLKEPEFNQVESEGTRDGQNTNDFRNTQEQVQDDDDTDDDPSPPKSPENSTCSKSAKDAFICLSNRLGDPTMNAIILDNLELICDPRYSSSSSSSSAQKRSKYVSKQKFFSWGGKRNNANVFYPWGGKRTTGRVHRQPKVVIRNPFHSWGGKRNPRDEQDY